MTLSLLPLLMQPPPRAINLGGLLIGDILCLCVHVRIFRLLLTSLDVVVWWMTVVKRWACGDVSHI